MLNIISHAGNANKTMMRYHCIPIRMAKSMKVIIPRVGKDVDKLGLSYPAGGNMERYNHFGKTLWQFLKQQAYIYHMIQLIHSQVLTAYVHLY